MQSILETFAYGNMSPNAQPCEENMYYSDAMRALRRNEEKLLEKLNEDEKGIFETYMNAQDQVRQLTAVRYWIDGYKLGLLLTAHVFVSDSDLVSP